MSTRQSDQSAIQPEAAGVAANVRVAIDLPREIEEIVGSPEALAERARRSLVLDLLREGEISQGKAARLLGLSRWDLPGVMARYHIPSGPLTVEELERDLEAARLGALRTRRHGGD